MAEKRLARGSTKTAGRFRWLSWVAGAALIVGLCLWLGVGELLRVLKTLRPMALLLAMSVFVLGHVVRIVKWHLPLGSHYGWLELSHLFLMSKIGGALLPGRVGEIAPVAKTRFRSTTVMAWLAVDRVMEGYATLAFGALGLASLELGDQRVVALWVGTFIVLLVLLVLMLYRPLWSWLEDHTRQWRRLSQLFGLARRISEDMLQFRRHALPALGLTLLGTYLDLWLIKILFLSTGTMVTMNVISASYCLGALITLVSVTPGGLGIVEVTSLYVYDLYGVPEIQTGVVMLLLRGTPLLQVMALALASTLDRLAVNTCEGLPPTVPQSETDNEAVPEAPRLKICLTASDGGHLTDLLQLDQEVCREHQVFYLTHRSRVTENLPDAYLVEKIGLSVWRMFIATLTTLGVFWRERPDVIISTGAEIAIPEFYLGKFLFGARLVYIECSGVTTHSTHTGKLVYPITDLFLVQWETLLEHYGPRAHYVGGLI